MISKNKANFPVKKYLLSVEIERDGEFFIASCPNWADCYAQGSSIDQATAEIVSVASGLIDLYEDEGLKIPLKKLANKFAVIKPTSFF